MAVVVMLWNNLPVAAASLRGLLYAATLSIGLTARGSQLVPL
jgi:hypothetical protein